MGASETGKNSGETVLVVDDNWDLVRIITLNLELEGYRVIAAYNGAEALEAVSSAVPDCILLDIMMPVMDGWEVLDCLRRNPETADTPVIIITARTSDVDKIKGFSGGAMEYLTKPFDLNTLVKTVKRVLRPEDREKREQQRGEKVRQLQLATILEVTNAVIGTLDLEEVLEIIVQRLLELFDLTVCGISLVGRNGKHLRLAAYKCSSSEMQEEARLFQFTLESLSMEILERLKEECGSINLRSPHLEHPEPAKKVATLNNIYVFPLMVRSRLIGILAFTRESVHEYGKEEEDLLTAVCNQAALAIENSRLYEDLRREHEVGRELLRRSTTAQEDERSRLAKELHDGVIQALVSALYRLQFAMAGVRDLPEEVRASLEEARETLDASIDEMRRLIEGLRPPLLDDLGLARAIERYAVSMGDTAGLCLELRLQEADGLLPEAEISIYRIAQECINNVFKHSGCSRCEVSLEMSEDVLELVIKDDGVGFDLDETASRIEGSFGLAGMRERAESMGGTLEIDSACGRGSRISLVVPLERIRRKQP
jgi:signal transduction histidine kinase